MFNGDALLAHVRGRLERAVLALLIDVLVDEPVAGRPVGEKSPRCDHSKHTQSSQMTAAQTRPTPATPVTSGESKAIRRTRYFKHQG